MPHTIMLVLNDKFDEVLVDQTTFFNPFLDMEIDIANDFDWECDAYGNVFTFINERKILMLDFLYPCPKGKKPTFRGAKNDFRRRNIAYEFDKKVDVWEDPHYRPRKLPRGVFEYKKTSLRYGLWGAQIVIGGQQRYLNDHETCKKAALRYDEEAIKYGLPLDVLNFPDDEGNKRLIKQFRG